MAFKPTAIDDEEEPKPGFKPTPIEEPGEKPSLLDKTVSLYNKTIDPLRRTATSAINAGVENLQKTPISEFVTSPIDSTIGLAKDVVKAGKRGFEGKEDKRGKDILKAIPEMDSDVVIPGVRPIRKVVEKLADKFVSSKERRDDGTEVERFNHLPKDEDDQLTDFANQLDRVANLMPDFFSKGVLNATSGAIRNPQAVLDVIDKVPLPGEVPDVPLNAVNAPKRAAEFSIDVLTDPLNYILPGASAAGKRVLSLPAVGNAVGKSVAALRNHPGLKVFQRAYGAPKGFVEALDDTQLRIAQFQEKAVQHAEYMRKTFGEAELKRIGQIQRSTDDLTAFKSTTRPDLYEAALESQKLFGEIESEARQLGMLKDTFTTRLTRKELAKLRTERSLLEKKMAKVQGGGFPKDRILDMANKVGLQGDVALANELRDTAKNFSLKGFRTRRNFQAVMDAVEESKKLPVRSKGRFLNLLMKTENVVGEQRYDVVQEMMDIADDVKDLKIKGLKPMIRQILGASARFPGQAKLTRQLEGNIDEITNRIYVHYTKGGQGYMPRLYDFFEKGYQNKLGEVGVNLKDIVAMEGDQLKALTSLNKGEFDELINKLRKVKGDGFGKKVSAIPTDAFKRRQDVTQALRTALGEIQTADYPLAARAGIQKRAVEFNKFFKVVSANREWAMPLDEFNKAPKTGWMKLPENKRLGDLSGMVVRDDIGRELQHTVRTLGKWQEGWLKALSAWKSGKVLYNPATHFRNIFSNMILMDASGVDLLEQPRLLSKATREILNKGKYWDEAYKEGLFTNSGYADAELRTFLRSFEKVKDDPVSRAIYAAKDLTDKLGQAYSSNEAVFKLSKFMHLREKGVPVKEAFQEAEKWLFNYSKLSPATRVLRSMPLGSPFLTFTAKALPRMAESFVNNPLRLYKYKAMFNALENMAQDKLGLTEDDIRYSKKGFRGTGVVLPVGDANGDPYVLDVSYILPWGDITEGAGPTGVPSAVPPGGPLKTMLEARMNYSEYTGKGVRNQTENWWIQAADTVDYVTKALLPSLTPGVNMRESPVRGGYSFNKIVSAIRKTPDYRGRVRSLGMVMADVAMGLKAYPQDPDFIRAMQAIEAKRSIQDRKTMFKRVMRHPGISPEAKARERMRFIKDVERIMLKNRE